MRVLHLFLSLILLTTTCFGQYLKSLPGMPFVNRAHRLGRGLVAYWPLNERSGNKVFDLSGNGNTGTATGAVSWVPGKFGMASRGEGSNGHYNLDTTLQIADTNPWSLVFWANADIETLAIMFGDNSGTTDYIMLRGGNYLQFQSNGASINFAITDFTGWHQYFLGSDGSNIYLYRDDVFHSLQDKVDCRLHINTLLGGHSTTSWDWLGMLDHALVYNRLLSASERAELYREPFGMFQKDNTALIASVEAPPPPTGGQFIMIQMSMIPLFLIFTLVCFIRGKENGK